MVDNLLVYDLLLVALLWLGVVQYKRWARNRAATGPTPRRLATPLPKHSRDSTLFPGLTHKPHCAACEQAPEPAKPAPLPPPLLPTPQGRPRQARWIARYSFVLSRAVSLMAGWGEAICEPMATLAVGAGASSNVGAASSTFWR